jgi:hypothetical protein
LSASSEVREWVIEIDGVGRGFEQSVSIRDGLLAGGVDLSEVLVFDGGGQSMEEIDQLDGGLAGEFGHIIEE